LVATIRLTVNPDPANVTAPVKSVLYVTLDIAIPLTAFQPPQEVLKGVVACLGVHHWGKQTNSIQRRHNKNYHTANGFNGSVQRQYVEYIQQTTYYDNKY
jgi:hypothetical protein